ncbi:acyltransferase [Acetobacter conturbans]|nr:acyltransferase [Acetobacter conturbans]
MAGASFGEDCYVSPTSHVYTTRISLGDKSYISGGCIIRGTVEIGRNSGIGTNCHVAGPIRIGSDTMIANNVSIFGFNHGTKPTETMKSQPCFARGVVVGDDCWIGANVSIVDGVIIGDHSIVAAGAVVTTDVPPWSVVGGVPARIIKRRLPEEVNVLDEMIGKTASTG